MKGNVLLGTALSVGLLFSVKPQQQALAAKRRPKTPLSFKSIVQMNWAILY